MAIKKDGSALDKLRERILPVLHLQGRETADLVIYEAGAPDASCNAGGAIVLHRAPGIDR